MKLTTQGIRQLAKHADCQASCCQLLLSLDEVVCNPEAQIEPHIQLVEKTCADLPKNRCQLALGCASIVAGSLLCAAGVVGLVLSLGISMPVSAVCIGVGATLALGGGASIYRSRWPSRVKKQLLSANQQMLQDSNEPSGPHLFR